MLSCRGIDNISDKLNGFKLSNPELNNETSLLVKSIGSIPAVCLPIGFVSTTSGTPFIVNSVGGPLKLRVNPVALIFGK